MQQLKIDGTAAVVARFVRVPPLPIDREAEIVAAGGTDHRGGEESRRAGRLSERCARARGRVQPSRRTAALKAPP